MKGGLGPPVSSVCRSSGRAALWRRPNSRGQSQHSILVKVDDSTLALGMNPVRYSPGLRSRESAPARRMSIRRPRQAKGRRSPRGGGVLRGADRTRGAPGFTPIELLIVVSILLVIAAIAVPNFLRARGAASEASAASSCRSINTAEFTYNAFYAQGYSSTVAQLGPPAGGPPTAAAANLIDQQLASGQRSGYSFPYTPGDLVGAKYTTYQLQARPSVAGGTGMRYFFSDPSGVIRANAGAPAGPSSPPIS
jgi:type IV pilus assembly protein PilA